MKVLFIAILLCYMAGVAYLYFTQTSQVFNSGAIKSQTLPKPYEKYKTSLQLPSGIILDGIEIKKGDSKELYLYFGGNADDARQIVGYLPHLKKSLIAFNYRGYVNSEGEPSQEALFEDALYIYDKFAKDKEVIAIGRSLGTGVVSYLASKRKLKGAILITPYDSINSIAKRKYPIFPIDWLLRHKFESTKYLQNLTTPIGLIEVEDDRVVAKYHFDKLKSSVKNLALHVSLKDTSHAEVLSHRDFEQSIEKISEKF